MTTPEHPTPAERREWAEGLLRDATPGPWTAERFYQKHCERIPDGWRWGIEDATGYLATLPEDDESTARADAALIAAAPDLAAAVRDLADELANRDAILGAVAQSVDALTAERDALREQVERLRDGETWDECDTCGVPIFRHYAWSHPAGTPPQDHDAEPAEGRQP